MSSRLWDFMIFRERMSSFSLDLQSFGLSVRRSKKQSRSTRRGLRVDIDLVEFRQLQEVGIFSYLCYSLAKIHVNGWGCSKAWISRFFGHKSFEPSGENLHCRGREQCQPEGFTVHMNSDMIFGVNFYDVE